jgi:hypothetical protein
MTKTTSRKVREYQENGTFIDRDMTESEIAQSEIDAQVMIEEEAGKQVQDAARAALLERLGISEEEAKLLLK